MTVSYGELKCKNCGVGCDGLENLNDHEERCRLLIDDSSNDLTDVMKGYNVSMWARVPVEVIGHGSPKALPRYFSGFCSKCKKHVQVPLGKKENLPLLAAYLKGDKAECQAFAKTAIATEAVAECRDGKKHPWDIQESRECMNYSQLVVRSRISSAESFAERNYRSYIAHLIDREEPISGELVLEGMVINEDNKDVSFLAYDYEQTDSQFNSDVSDDLKADFEKHFRNNPAVVADLVDSYAPYIAGKDLVREGWVLVLHSPAQFRFNNKLERALLRGIEIGPTKTAKSTTAKAAGLQYSAGEYTTGETSSRAGLAYFVDTERRIIEWGLLPRNDLKLAVIAGLHQFNSQEYLEALETNFIKVDRMIKGQAPCRTRIICDANPHDQNNRVAGIHRCTDILKAQFFSKYKATITRFDLFFVANEDDIDQCMINATVRNPRRVRIPDGIVSQHIQWVWSLKPDDLRIGMDEEEYNSILEKADKYAIDLVGKYGVDDIPVVHRGALIHILRLAWAYAAISHSTDEDKLVMQEIHVDEAFTFLDHMCKALELDAYKEFRKDKTELLSSDLRNLLGELDVNTLTILEGIACGLDSSTRLQQDLQEKGIELSMQWIRESHYPKLKNLGLIESNETNKVWVTEKGRKLLKLLQSAPLKGAAVGKKPTTAVLEAYDKGNGGDIA